MTKPDSRTSVKMNLGQLRAHDRHFVTKLAFRVLIIVFDLATVIMTGHVHDYSKAQSEYGFAARIGLWFLFPLLLAMVWSATSIGIQLYSKRPVHPGFPVSFHLVFWIALGAAAGIMTSTSSWALFSSRWWWGTVDDSSSLWSPYSSFWSFGYDGPVTPTNAPGFSGWATSAMLTAIRERQNYTYTATNGSSSIRSYDSPGYRCPNWDSCTQRYAAYKRVDNELILTFATSVMLCIASILEFILFVWACVDCKAHNMRLANDADVEARAHKLAQQMVAEQEELAAAQGHYHLEQQQQQQQISSVTPAYDFVTSEK